MTSNYSDNTDKSLDDSLDNMLNELSFEPVGEHAAPHQAPANLQQRILLAQQNEVSASNNIIVDSPSQPPATGLGLSDFFLSELFSPWRAFVASAATLLLGVLLGSSTPAAELYTAALNPNSYPDNDQLLVIASLDDDFASILGDELIEDWAPSELATEEDNSQ